MIIPVHNELPEQILPSNIINKETSMQAYICKMDVEQDIRRTHYERAKSLIKNDACINFYNKKASIPHDRFLGIFQVKKDINYPMGEAPDNSM